MDGYAAVAAGLYLVVAVGFGAATFAEGWHRRDGWDGARVTGLAACAFWPLLIVAVMLPVAFTRSLRLGPGEKSQS